MISLPGSTVAFSFGNRPRIDNEVTDLPLPDSPTSATVLFCGMSKLIPFTASNVVCLSSRKLTRRLRTERMFSMVTCSLRSLEFRIERIAQRIREQAEGGHQHRHEGAGCGQLPPFA